MKRSKRRRVFIQKIRTGWISVLLVSLVSFAALAATIPEAGGSRLDQWAEAWMSGWKSDGMTGMFTILSYFGSTAAIAGMTLIAAAAVWIAQGWKRGVAILAGMAAAYLLNSLLKSAFERARPVAAWGIEADGASFPSGNAMLGFVMFGLIALTVILSARSGRAVKAGAAAAAVIFIGLMGLSRVYFHVHYISDILGGYAAGLATISLVMLVLQAAERRKGAAKR
ncbi:phosphatase PAP2 family protein [Paenibacillus sp. N4]|uniref:phosphatase PAP2 family protein n=1 Tax=Paenibacillus vietnamensis TaxID=2590547 RepID=UPI001CD1944D|nr:phosphatase PAP2 family protein [Paenibacillus vietnamensis]MCA0758514.1 phosphatase PAP2 family protein [Paenibacillus vietnamensis]